MSENNVVRFFGRSGPSKKMMHRVLAALVVVWLVCTVLALSGCSSDTPYVVSRTVLKLECNPSKVAGHHCIQVK